MKCPVCESSIENLVPFYEQSLALLSVAWLPKQPMTNSGYGKIQLIRCNACEYVFNGTFDSQKADDLYLDDGYVVKQNATPGMSGALKTVFDFVSPHFKKGNVLEVAPGNGALAFAFSKLADRVVTVDPAPSAQKSINTLDAENITHITDFFSAEVLGKNGVDEFELVAARHLIEHLPRPVSFLKDVHNVLSEEGLVYIECPDFDEISNSGRYYDVFHDHFGYFNRPSFSTLCRRAGFEIVDELSLFSGQHMGFLLRKGNGQKALVGNHQELDFSLLNSNRQELSQLIDDVEGEVALWGAGAHGNAFVSCLTPEQRQKIVCCFDKDPAKSGRYLQDSTALITTPDRKKICSYKTIFVVASLYEDVIIKEIKSCGFQGQILKTAYINQQQSWWESA